MQYLLSQEELEALQVAKEEESSVRTLEKLLVSRNSAIRITDQPSMDNPFREQLVTISVPKDFFTEEEINIIKGRLR